MEAGAEKQAHSPLEAQIITDGFAIVPDVLPLCDVEALIETLEALFADTGKLGGKGVYGVRGLLDTAPVVRRLAATPLVRRLVEPILGKECFAVRGIFFDKIAGANWKVPWHQDLTIALRERGNAEGFGPFSEKAGVVHAQAPAALLENMLTVRLHLDACDETNGPLRVLPGTHNTGRLNAEEVQTLRTRIAPVLCVVGQGGAVLMRPLLLHASLPAQMPRHRRVLHLEYAKDTLPRDLQWHTQVR